MSMFHKFYSWHGLWQLRDLWLKPHRLQQSFPRWLQTNQIEMYKGAGNTGKRQNGSESPQRWKMYERIKCSVNLRRERRKRTKVTQQHLGMSGLFQQRIPYKNRACLFLFLFYCIDDLYARTPCFLYFLSLSSSSYLLNVCFLG